LHDEDGDVIMEDDTEVTIMGRWIEAAASTTASVPVPALRVAELSPIEPTHVPDPAAETEKAPEPDPSSVEPTNPSSVEPARVFPDDQSHGASGVQNESPASMIPMLPGMEAYMNASLFQMQNANALSGLYPTPTNTVPFDADAIVAEMNAIADSLVTANVHHDSSRANAIAFLNMQSRSPSPDSTVIENEGQGQTTSDQIDETPIICEDMSRSTVIPSDLHYPDAEEDVLTASFVEAIEKQDQSPPKKRRVRRIRQSEVNALLEDSRRRR